MSLLLSASAVDCEFVTAEHACVQHASPVTAAQTQESANTEVWLKLLSYNCMSQGSAL